MDFNQIRYFLALADTLKFTRAAERCYVSQPALTQAIKRLESELGGELIDRNQMELTDLGKALRGHFEDINRTRLLVRSTAKAVIDSDFAELNIGIMCTIGPRVIAGMLDAFQMSHPTVQIILHDVVPTSIPEMLLSGGLDGALCAHHGPRHSKLQYFDLFKEAMVITFPPGHEFSKMDAVPMLEIGKHRYVERLYCEFREEFVRYYSARGLDLDVVFRCQREDWIQSMVRDGIGVSLIPQYSLLRPELDHRPVTDPPLFRHVSFAVAAQTEIKSGLKLFIEQVQNYAWPKN